MSRRVFVLRRVASYCAGILLTTAGLVRFWQSFLTLDFPGPDAGTTARAHHGLIVIQALLLLLVAGGSLAALLSPTSLEGSVAPRVAAGCLVLTVIGLACIAILVPDLMTYSDYYAD